MDDAHCLSSEVPIYRYSALDHTLNETRFAELLPGNYDDDLHFKIHSMPIHATDGKSQNPGFCVEDLLKGLPHDWYVREALNGRFIFERKKSYGPQDPCETSWIHPKAKFEPVANNYNLLHTKPEYEALSHVWGY